MEESYFTTEVKELFALAEDITKMNARIAKLNLDAEVTRDASRAIDNAMRAVVKTAASIICDNLSC